MGKAQGTFPHRDRSPRTLTRASLWLALLATAPLTSRAFDLEYEAGLAVKRSDNINLSEFDPISDTVITPTLQFQIEQQGPRVQIAARGDAQYLHYASNTFDDEVRGTFAGKLNWSVLPGRMDFVVQDYLSRQPVDELSPQTPTNEQQANVFLAGPSFYARFSPTTRGQLDLRYTNSYAEDNSAFNGDRYDAAVRLLHDLTRNQSVSLNLEATRTRFDGAGAAADYTAYDGYVGYKTRRSVVSADLAVGHTRLEPRNGSPSVDAALVRGVFDWRLSRRSLLTATVRHQLSDATQSLISYSQDMERRNFNDFLYLDVAVRPNPYRERMLRVRYQFTGARTTFRVVPYYRRIRYIDDLSVNLAPESQDRTGVLTELLYRVRPRMDLSVQAIRERREYVDLDRRDTDTGFSVGLSNRFTRHWTGRVDLQRRERDSSAFGRSYDANAVILSVTYRR